MANLLKEICEGSDLNISDVISHLNTASLEYKVFTIPKKTKGVRVIAQPTPFVKTVQKAIIEILLSKFSLSEACTAYMKGKSIVDNAEVHKHNDWVFKLDFEDFFPSIKPNDLFVFFENESFFINEFDKKILSSYLFRKNNNNLELSIGAPSSPIISNMIMKYLDFEIVSYCNSKNIVYTRYADDLTFSSNKVEVFDDLLLYINELLSKTQNPKLRINKKKTRTVGLGRSRRITGIIITNTGELSVGRYCRKKIRAMLYRYSSRTINKSHIPYLHGMVSHMRNVEPKYYDKLLTKYGDDFFIKLAMDSYKISKAIKEKEMAK